MIDRRTMIKGLTATTGLAALGTLPAAASEFQNTEVQPEETYSSDEILRAGHSAFGEVTQGLAGVVEHLFRDLGRPNGYVIGEEGGGAFVAGLRYGEGMLTTRNAGNHPIFWQGPSIGFDFGVDGARTLILVYNLPSVDAIYQRFGGLNGQAYVVAGLGASLYGIDGIFLAPIRSGVGARLGANIGYINVTRQPTWNPF